MLALELNYVAWLACTQGAYFSKPFWDSSRTKKTKIYVPPFCLLSSLGKRTIRLQCQLEAEQL